MLGGAIAAQPFSAPFEDRFTRGGCRVEGAMGKEKRRLKTVSPARVKYQARSIERPRRPCRGTGCARSCCEGSKRSADQGSPLGDIRDGIVSAALWTLHKLQPTPAHTIQQNQRPCSGGQPREGGCLSFLSSSPSNLRCARPRYTQPRVSKPLTSIAQLDVSGTALTA